MATGYSAHAIAALRDLARAPAPRQVFNSGVISKLERDGLAENYLAPTPYRTRTGLIQFSRLTEAGRASLANFDIRNPG